MKKRLLIALASAMLIAGCNNTNNADTTENANPTTVPSGEVTSTSTNVNDVFDIYVYCPEGINYSLNKQQAMAGETVELTLVAEPGYAVTSVKMNNEELRIASGKYSFTMPKKPANIIVTASYNPGEEDEYNINVSAPSIITYTLNKNRAKEGELIELTLTVPEKCTVTSVKMNGTELTQNAGKYSFTMPNRVANIVVLADIDGDVTLVGELTASLVDEGDGIYVARNVKVESNNARVGFSYMIKGENGASQVVDSLMLDETKCFANVTFSTGTSYELTIASGATYDFFYDPNAQYPCYIIRKNVDVLPTSATQIYSLFDGRMRSEPTLHPADLKEINYTYTTNNLAYEYNYKKYQGNTSLAVAVDKTNDVNKEYYVYKNINTETNQYEVVNTWPKALGNNENGFALWSLDPYQNDTANQYGQPFSVKQDIVADSEEGSRTTVPMREALRNVAMGAHYGAELEYEFYDAYRGGQEGEVIINAPSWTTMQINTTPVAGGFKSVVTSAVEHNQSASGSEPELHQAAIYNLELEFLNNGALKELNYSKVFYAQSAWNFTDHTPIGTGTETVITCVNTYGEAFSGKPDFDASKYFISSIDNLEFYNPKTKYDRSETVDYVQLQDTFEIVKYMEGGALSDIVYKFEYSPSTALDAWQYTTTASSNTEVVALNGQRKFEAINVGQSTLTITNRTKHSAASVQRTVEVIASGSFHGLFINGTKQGYDSFDCERSDTAVVMAGTVSRWYIDASYNTGAPIVYTITFRTKNQYGDYVYSDESPYVKVLTTGQVLTLDTNTEAALALTSEITLTCKLMSNFYADNWGPSDLYIKIKPASGETIVGSSWIKTYIDSQSGQPINDYTTCNLTATEDNGKYKGSITDYIYNGSTLQYTDTWNFLYTVNASGNINSVNITSVSVQTPGFSQNTYDYTLTFYGIDQGYLFLNLYYWPVYGDVTPILGDAYEEDEYGVEIAEWAYFERVN